MIKKYILYLTKDKQRLKEYNISQEEIEKIDYGYEVEKNNMINKKNKPYILLNKVINNERSGNPGLFNRVIYFKNGLQINARKKILSHINKLTRGRNEVSIQNLTFLSKQTLDFISSEFVKIKKEEEEIEKGKKKKKK